VLVLGGGELGPELKESDHEENLDERARSEATSKGRGYRFSEGGGRGGSGRRGSVLLFLRIVFWQPFS